MLSRLLNYANYANKAKENNATSNVNEGYEVNSTNNSRKLLPF